MQKIKKLSFFDKKILKNDKLCVKVWTTGKPNGSSEKQKGVIIMEKLNNFTMHASKVMEILFWVITAFVLVSVIVCAIGGAVLNEKLRENDQRAVEWMREAIEGNAEISIGDHIKLADEILVEENYLKKDGTLNLAVITVTILYGLFNCAAFAMIFRNVNLILKTAKGKTWFAEGETPFQKDITRMIREIGIFLLILAAIGFLISLFVETVEFSLLYVVIGLLMLCLSSFFSYGEQLQKETDGLV